jgi:hypothetical protein
MCGGHVRSPACIGQEYTATTKARICTNLSCLVLRDDTSGLELQCVFRKPRIFIRSLLIFKGAHEIASLSCYFLFMQKVEKANRKGKICSKRIMSIGY